MSVPTLSPVEAGALPRRPRLAILFWFYKDFEVCRSRIEDLRRLNPRTSLYGLYGGEPDEGGAARAALGDLLDDLYLFDRPSTAQWRWIHGDHVIAAWAQRRGFALPWDTVVLVQWDMLLAAPIASLFDDLREDEAVFSGDRPLAGMEDWWGWGGAHQAGRDALDAFSAWLKTSHGYEGPLWACLFILAALPRTFLERFISDGPPEPGFLEYKLPTLARVYGTPVRAAPLFTAWWKAEPASKEAPASARMINAAGEEPSDEAVARELADPLGRRAFHPISRAFSVAEAAVAPSAPSGFVCSICGSPDGRLHDAREMMFGFRNRFTYGECAACGCVQLLDPPADLGRYYGPAYYSFDADLDAEFRDPEVRRTRGEAVHALLTFEEGQARQVVLGDTRRPLWSLRRLGLTITSRILDVGCGAGRLLYLLNLGGFVGGLGIDPFLPHDLTGRNGPSVLKAQLSQVEGGWDAIMLHHAFEHLPNPAEALAAAAARVKPGGVVLLRLPVADSDAFRIYGPDWVQLDAPRHFFLHTRASLQRLADDAGLVLEAVACDSHELQFWGSEQYLRDIPLHDPRSRWGGAPGIFPPEQIAAWRRQADVLNERGRGDQAAVYLRRPLEGSPRPVRDVQP